MRKLWICGGLGIVVALLPFLGFPPDWERVFTIALGIAIAVLAFRSVSLVKNRTTDESTP